MQQRDKYWDYLKGLAILLVLIGHSVQYGNGMDYFSSRDYLDNQIFMAIYGFHMPLFMFISGYFFFTSVNKRSFKETLINSVKTLYIPILAFSFLIHIQKIQEPSLMGIMHFIAKSIYGSTYTLWFLSAVMLAQISVGVINKYLRDNWTIYALFTLVLYVLPDYFQLAQAKFVYPFFLLGYFSRKYELTEKVFQCSRQIGTISIIVYAIMMIFLYNRDTYVYFTKVSLLSSQNLPYQIYCDTLRLIIGFFGVIGIICITRWIYCLKENLLINLLVQRLGMMTMGIYCFQDLLIALYMINPPPSVENNALVFFTILLSSSIILVHLSSLTKFSRILFLGGR